jgi:hypothetical protein
MALLAAHHSISCSDSVSPVVVRRYRLCSVGILRVAITAATEIGFKVAAAQSPRRVIVLPCNADLRAR